MILSLLLSIAFARTPTTPTTVPTIATTDFTVGRAWTWDYFDPRGQIYSTERYTVLSVTGDVVWIEMSSSYNGGTQLTPHHRLEVNVRTCLDAYKNPARKKPWSFDMYSLDHGKWVKFDPEKTLAFEEKFNCNPHVFSKPHQNYLTVFSSIRGEDVFQQKLWGKLTSSWFSMNGRDRAVALEKEFSSDPTQPYVFKRRP